MGELRQEKELTKHSMGWITITSGTLCFLCIHRDANQVELFQKISNKEETNYCLVGVRENLYFLIHCWLNTDDDTDL